MSVSPPRYQKKAARQDAIEILARHFPIYNAFGKTVHCSCDLSIDAFDSPEGWASHVAEELCGDAET